MVALGAAAAGQADKAACTDHRPQKAPACRRKRREEAGRGEKTPDGLKAGCCLVLSCPLCWESSQKLCWTKRNLQQTRLVLCVLPVSNLHMHVV